jgi:cobalt-zinc-cadmium efflux system outer membrane protein
MVRIVIVLAICAAAMLPRGAASAREPAPADIDFAAPLHVEALVAHARRHNPEIRAAEARVRAARARLPQAGALPDPMLDLGYHNESFDRLTQGESEFAWLRFGASQEVPFPGKLGLREEIARRDAEREAALTRGVHLDVIGRLKVSYFEYAHLQELIAIVERSRGVLERIARTAEARYAVGEGVQQDVLRAQLELSLLLERLTRLEQQRRSTAAELNALLDRPPHAPLGPAEHVTRATIGHPLDALRAAAEAHSPALAAARERVAGAESGVALARREYYPDLVVKADYMNKARLLPEWELGVGITVPLYFSRKQRSGVDEAAAMAQEARGERRTSEQMVLFRVQDLFARGESAERLVSLYDTAVLPQARLALEAATAAFEVGSVDFLTVLNAFSVLLDYEMRYHEELAALQKTVAELEAVVGQPLAAVTR